MRPKSNNTTPKPKAIKKSKIIIAPSAAHLKDNSKLKYKKPAKKRTVPVVKRPKLDDVTVRHMDSPKTFKIPSTSQIADIKVADTVKVIASGERFWCEISEVKSFGKFVGKIVNDIGVKNLYCGDFIAIGRQNICGINREQERIKQMESLVKKIDALVPSLKGGDKAANEIALIKAFEKIQKASRGLNSLDEVAVYLTENHNNITFNRLDTFFKRVHRIIRSKAKAHKDYKKFLKFISEYPLSNMPAIFERIFSRVPMKTPDYLCWFLKSGAEYSLNDMLDLHDPNKRNQNTFELCDYNWDGFTSIIFTKNGRVLDMFIDDDACLKEVQKSYYTRLNIVFGLLVVQIIELTNAKTIKQLIGIIRKAMTNNSLSRYYK